MKDQFYAIGTIRVNPSKKSYKITLNTRSCGIIARRDLIALIEGKITSLDIVSFKTHYLARRDHGSKQNSAANPEKLQANAEAP